MLEGLVKTGVVAQLADHGDSILSRQKHAGVTTALGNVQDAIYGCIRLTLVSG